MARPETLAKIAKALSVDTRVRLLRLLKDRCMCVGAAANRLGLTPGAVSQHLRILREAGLVIPEKRGYYVHYRVDQAALNQWLSEMEQALGEKAEPEFGGFVFPLAPKIKGGQDV